MRDLRRVALKKNTTTSLIFEVATVICGFILPKFILQYYGSATNGLVSSISHFLGFISLCELGMGAVVPANLYKPLAEKNESEVNKIMTSAQKFYRMIAGILLLYVIVLSIVYPKVVTDFDYLFTTSLIIIISLSTFAQYYFGITYSLLLKADQKQYVSLTINTITLIANTVVSVALICLGFSIHVVKCFSAIIFILRPLYLTYYVKRNYTINTKAEYSEEPIQQKWNGVAQHLASTVQEKADTIILTLFCTLESVSVYSVYFMVVNGIKGLVYSLTAGMSAMIGNIIAKNEKAELNRVFSYFEWGMHSVSTLLFTITGLLIVPFVKVYTISLIDTDIYIEPLFAYILCIALAARCIQMPYNVVVQAANHFKSTQNSAIIEPVINVVVSVILVYNYGLVGVAVGTLVSMLYRVFYLAIYLMHNIVFIKPLAFVKQLLIDILSACLTILVSIWIPINAISYLQWIVSALIISGISACVCVLVNLIFYRSYMVSILHSILGRAKRRK